MRRQLSDSAVISTGRPERVNTKAISWSRVGPERTLTRSGLRLTKRGTGRPLAEPGVTSLDGKAVLGAPLTAGSAATASKAAAHERRPDHGFGRGGTPRPRITAAW